MELGIGLVPYSPLGKGFLTGKIDENTQLESGDFRNILPRFTPEAMRTNRALVDLLGTIAERKRATPAQIAIAWLLARSGPLVIPIVGARTAEQLRQSLAGVDLDLSQDALLRLSDVSGFPLGFPHDFLAGLHARAAIGGVIKAVPSTRGREIADVN